MLKKSVSFTLFLLSVFSFSQNAYNNAIVCFKNYDLECAKENFQKHILANPSDFKAIGYLGDIAVDQKDWEKAIMLYKSLLNADPNNADYYFKYGGAIGLKALNIGRINALFLVDDIRDNFLEATRLDNKHIEARWGLVEFYVNLPVIIGGGNRKAMRYAQELYALSKVDGLMAKGYIAIMDDESEQAQELYREAVMEGIKLHDYNKTTILDSVTVINSRYGYDRNQLHYQLGKAAFQYQIEMDKGLAHLKYFVTNYGVKDHITKDWGYYFMAKIYKYKGNVIGANAALNKALQLRPDFEEALQFKKEI